MLIDFVTEFVLEMSSTLPSKHFVITITYSFFQKPDGSYLHVTNTSFTDGGEYECTVKSAVGQISSKTTVVVHGAPGPPGGVTVVAITMSSATLQWTDGASNGRPIVFYKISARTNWNSTWANISDCKLGISWGDSLVFKMSDR